MAIQLKSEIALVNDERNLLLSHETRITQNENAISLLATETQINELTGQLDTLEAELLIQAGQISAKVSETDYTGNTIASKINQTATTIKLQASKIDLTGYVTVTNLSTAGQTTINGSNITTGALNANLITTGKITAVDIEGVTITGGTINGTTINTSQDINVGQSVSIPVSVPTTGTELILWSTRGGKGLRFGNPDGSGLYPAFISVVNMKTIAGLPDDLIRMRIKASERLIITSDQIFLEFGGNSYAVSRRSSDGALILS